jgi:hypothetical protein
MAVGCFVACFGAGVATMVQSTQASGIEAQAETTTRTITKAGQANGSTASALYLYALEGDACIEGVGNWDDRYYFVADSGNGIKFNGEDFDYEMKQPGDIYLVLGGHTAVAGDEVTIDGTFYNSTGDTNIVFKNCGLRYNGTAWESFTPSAVHDIGALILHGNSNVGGASKANNQLYLMKTDGSDLPVKSWDYFFTAENADNFKVNGGTATATTFDEKEVIKLTGGTWANIFIAPGKTIGQLQAYDKIVITMYVEGEVAMQFYSQDNIYSKDNRVVSYGTSSIEPGADGWTNFPTGQWITVEIPVAHATQLIGQWQNSGTATMIVRNKAFTALYISDITCVKNA